MGGQGPGTTKKQVEMRRGKSWDLHENETLARAWIAASEDPVAGIDQRGKVFFDTMHRRFSEKGPESSTGVEGRYGLRTADSIRKHLNELSADVQKFSKTRVQPDRCDGGAGVGNGSCGTRWKV